jgi:hypothetical protein
MSSLSRMKNPDLPYLHVAAALQAYSTSSSLDVLNSLGTTASFSSLSKAGVHYVPARPCRSIAVYLLLFLPYLDRPLCAISYLTIAIYTMPPFPLRPIEGVRGIHP